MTVNTTENTPKHCHDCYKLTECKQAQYMNANTEPFEFYQVSYYYSLYYLFYGLLHDSYERGRRVCLGWRLLV